MHLRPIHYTNGGTTQAELEMGGALRRWRVVDGDEYDEQVSWLREVPAVSWQVALDQELAAVAKARAICLGCDELIACYDRACRNDERDGVWGGVWFGLPAKAGPHRQEVEAMRAFWAPKSAAPTMVA